MKIYDISQEVLGCAVFPGDPAPKSERLMSIRDGAVCNLTAFSMCAHNGTHLDAPCHFLDDGATVDRLPLSKTVGYAYVAEHEGVLTAAILFSLTCITTTQHTHDYHVLRFHSSNGRYFDYEVKSKRIVG